MYTSNTFSIFSITSTRDAKNNTYDQGLLGDALAEKIVEMHESCVESGLDGGDAARPTTSASGSRGEAGGRRESGGTSKSLASAATPKEYVSFLKSWFDMHESKKVLVTALHRGITAVSEAWWLSRIVAWRVVQRKP